MTASDDDPLDEDDDEGGLLAEFVGLGLAFAILLAVLGFTGGLFAFGDSLAVGRGYAVAAVLVLAIAASFLGMRVAAFWSILFALAAGAPVVLATLWPGPPGEFTLYQKNLRFDNAELAALEADIRAANPLAMTLQEVSEPNLALLSALADTWPHQHVCPFAAVGGTAVATRLPPVPGATVCAPGLAAMQVMVTETQRRFPVWIVSIHLNWPWPHDQADHAAALRGVLDKLDGPVIMAGDFNMVRWGASVRSLAAATETLPAGPSPGTYTGFDPLLRLPIDHAFGPNGGRVTLRPTLGSDHLGLFVELQP
ncbi:MAG: endonuclease/exonuclease/phosphatase family protein [Rhodobacterales bacterium]|nr:endonuclease/exonuclease/phosphatase family protein [Rhodobacterales bacterium]